MLGIRAARCAGGLLLCAMLCTPAAAQVRDAIYRGTIVCTKLPFLGSAAREAFELTVVGTSGRYRHTVRDLNEVADEIGSGTIDGQTVVLTGSWRGKQRSYEARYTGNFARRSFTLKGTQTWVNDGKSYVRTCSGAIKRPFAVLLPKQKS